MIVAVVMYEGKHVLYIHNVYHTCIATYIMGIFGDNVENVQIPNTKNTRLLYLGSAL